MWACTGLRLFDEVKKRETDLYNRLLAYGIMAVGDDGLESG